MRPAPLNRSMNVGRRHGCIGGGIKSSVHDRNAIVAEQAFNNDAMTGHWLENLSIALT
ncbi:hypothetical protein [Aliihoeflea sp. PC F10.4]